MKRGHHRKVQTKTRPSTVLVSKKSIQEVDNVSDLDVILEKEKIFQDLLGFSRENIPQMYEQCILFLQTNRLEEAIAGFSLLTKINPYIADFWLGLGLCYKAREEFPKAMEAFIMAIALDPYRSEMYEFAVECSLDAKNIKQAKLFVDLALQYGKRHHSRELVALAKKLEENISIN